MRYDAQGHRVELVTRPSGGSDTTTTFRYQGDAIAQELVGGTVTRTYVTDETGAVVKFCDPDCTGANPQYLVTWNGHGDAASIWKIDTSTGGLTLANSYTYTTWGAPTTTTHNSFADLGFRFLYVGRYGVAWDNAFGLGLEYMSARHYSPALGRFLQPAADNAEPNVYSYVKGNPVTQIDPQGTCPWCIAIIVGIALFGGLGAANGTVNYAITTPSSRWSWSGAGDAALRGAGNTLSVASFMFPGPALARGWFALGRYIPPVVLRFAARMGSLPARFLTISFHAQGQMAEREITREMVNLAVRTGRQYWDPANRSINYVLTQAVRGRYSLVVGRNPVTGVITTVYYTLRLSPRLIRLR